MSNVKEIRTKSVPIKIDDKDYNLRYDMNAFADIEEEYGGINEAMSAMRDGSVVAMRKLLWFGLRHENESLTERQAGALLDLAGMSIVIEPLTEAIESSLPPMTDEEKKRAIREMEMGAKSGSKKVETLPTTDGTGSTSSTPEQSSSKEVKETSGDSPQKNSQQ